MRYSEHDKLLALGLFYKSPAAYRFMSSSFRLPSERTLQSFIGGFSIGCGFKSSYIRALDERTGSMTPQEKFCVLTFDGMALKSKLQYVESKDKITGFVDLDEFTDYAASPAVAKQALQFMVRGLSTKWKQPLGHFFTGHTVNSATLKQMVKRAVSLLESIGLTVLALVCDQEASHRTLYNSLGSTNEKPWFLSENGNKVYLLFDLPHIIKNLRNNLMNYDIIADGQTASFNVLRKMYELEKTSSLRLCPKLTDGHFYLKPFKKMKVSLATQVLSHSTAAAIKTYVHFGKLDKFALQTATFVEKIDRLFDILNSRTLNTKHKWKKPLSLSCKDQFQFLEECETWIKGWKFRHVASKKEKQHCHFIKDYCRACVQSDCLHFSCWTSATSGSFLLPASIRTLSRTGSVV